MEKSSTEIDDVSNTNTRTLSVQHSDSVSCLYSGKREDSGSDSESHHKKEELGVKAR